MITVLAHDSAGLEKLRASGTSTTRSQGETRLQQRLALVARVFASEKFLLANLVVVSTWIAVNLLLRASGRAAFDAPPTFFFLGFLIAVEALVIAIFVLNAQRRQAERDRIRADLEYQVNVKAHVEVMDLHRKMDRLMEKPDRDRSEECGMGQERSAQAGGKNSTWKDG